MTRELQVGDRVRLTGKNFQFVRDNHATIIEVFPDQHSGYSGQMHVDEGDQVPANYTLYYSHTDPRWTVELIEEPNPDVFRYVVGRLEVSANLGKSHIPSRIGVRDGDMLIGKFLFDTELEELITVLSYIKMERDKLKLKE